MGKKVNKAHVAIFGSGYIYRTYKELVEKEYLIEVILDNNINRHGQTIDGYLCIYPREVFNYEIDLIILMSDAYLDMKVQLLKLGYDEEKIVCYRDTLGDFVSNQKKYTTKIQQNGVSTKKSILIISNELRYTGAPIVVYRTAKVAIGLGYNVTVAAMESDSAILEDFVNNGIEVLLQENLKYASKETLFWTKEYDVIIVNTFVMGLCAIRIAESKKVLWWLHESTDVYPEMEFWYFQIKEKLLSDNLKIFSVSERAKENFLRFYQSNKVVKSLVVGIEDWKLELHFCNNNDTVTFALIGGMFPEKGHNILINAIEEMHNIDRSKFILIGKRTDGNYCKTIINRMAGINNSIIYGEISQEEIKKIYKEIDVVIVPSLEESFSMAAAEAMMMGKVCIISDSCGISEYIENGKNGLIFPAGDSYRLSYLMDWCVENVEERMKVGDRARTTYEKYFSMHIFSQNFNKILIDMEK